MSPQEEQTLGHDHTYSAWHRRMSISRFCDRATADKLGCIDIDAAMYVEYEDQSKEPLALFETAMDIGQPWKTATVIRNLAIMANIPAYCVLYRKSLLPNPADTSYADIEGFRIQRLYPDPYWDFKHLTPEKYCQALLKIRNWRGS